MEQWMHDVLRMYSAGELQYGAYIDELARDPDKKHKPIRERKRFVPGTGIPAYVMQKFREGIWTPREKTRKKLKNFWQRFQYQKFRSLGARRQDARKFSRTLDTKKYRDKVLDYQEYARKIGEVKGVDPKYIQYTMARSDIPEDDWDSYIAEAFARSRTMTLARNLKKQPPRKRKKKSRGTKKGLIDKYFSEIRKEVSDMERNDAELYLRSAREEIRRILDEEPLSAVEKGNFRKVENKLTGMISKYIKDRWS